MLSFLAELESPPPPSPFSAPFLPTDAGVLVFLVAGVAALFRLLPFALALVGVSSAADIASFLLYGGGGGGAAIFPPVGQLILTADRRPPPP